MTIVVTKNSTDITVAPEQVVLEIGTTGLQGPAGTTDYTELENKPTLGTAAARDVALSGDASSVQVVTGNDSRLTDARTPTAHTQAESSITNLIADLAAKSAVGHTHTKAEITDFPASMPASDVYAWAKAATQPAPLAHTHAESDITGLVADLADKDLIGKFSRVAAIENDCFSGTAAGLAPLPVTAILSGNIGNSVGGWAHPGTIYFKSSTSANSGAAIGDAVSISSLRLRGGETFQVCFIMTTPTGTTAYFGFHDSVNQVAPVDGVWLNMAGLVLSGICSNNSVATATASTYTMTQAIWYRATITLNANATLATFCLYSEAGVLLWTDTVSTNIPTASGREVGPTLTVTNSGTAVNYLLNVDWYRFTFYGSYVR